ncbi:MAG: hypothetical protein FKY71_19665, partial [Spiribacter salinus]
MKITQSQQVDALRRVLESDADGFDPWGSEAGQTGIEVFDRLVERGFLKVRTMDFRFYSREEAPKLRKSGNYKLHVTHAGQRFYEVNGSFPSRILNFVAVTSRKVVWPFLEQRWL